MAEEFISFDKVLRELQMQEAELKRLVSEGEIRAFRDQDKMKFKKEDVERFRKVRSKDDTLSQEDVPEELVFDEDDANQEVGMATAAIADDSFLEESSTAAAAKAAPAPKSAMPAAKGPRSQSQVSRKPRSGTVTIEDETATEGALWKIAIVLATVVLVLGIFVAMDATRATHSMGLTDSLANMFRDKK